MALFAFQEALAERLEIPFQVFILAIVGMSLLSVILFFWLIFRQASKSRQLSHLERMKALEMGHPAGPSETETTENKYLHNVFWVAFWIGGVVPMAATSAASSVMIQANIQEFRDILAIWICVAVIAVTGLTSAASLMASGRKRCHKSVKEAKTAESEKSEAV